MRDNNPTYTLYNKHYYGLYYSKQFVHDQQRNLSETSSQIVQPMKRDVFSCTIMILENLVVPGWISVSCNDAVVSEIVCVTDNTNTYKGINITKIKKMQVIKLTLFLCHDGQSISSSRQCNGINDCSDNADESNCFCFVNGRKVENSNYCKYHCQLPTCICHKLLLQGNYPGCHLFEQGKNEYFGFKVTHVKDLPHFECLNESKLIHMEKENDPISSCNFNIGEPILYSLLANKVSYISPELSNEQRYCNQSSYFTKHQCIYEINEKGTLQACRNGKHLENCTDFNCKSVGKYKCPGYYCIPMTYVCNGRIDCPRALDEKGCENYTCKRLFHCQNTSQCIYIVNVCDGMNDCPHGDDEFNCILHDYICPENCLCQIFAINCRFIYNTFSNQLMSFQRMIFIYFIGNTFISDFTWFSYLHKVEILNIHKFKLPDPCNTFDQSLNIYSSLLALDISKNQITIFRSYCLHSQNNMLLLNLSINIIIKIEDLAFNNLKRLSVLDLSNNKISFVKKKMFLGMEGIVFFKFHQNYLKEIPKMAFKHLILMKFIMTSDFKICCIKPCRDTICIIEPNISDNCQGLITNSIITTMMFVIASLIITFNLISLSRLTPRKNTCFNAIAKYLNLSDLSYGMYVIFIATCTIYFKTSFALNEMHWKSHMICYILCVLYTYFQLTSVVLTLFMALARWLVTRYPLTSRFKHISFATLCLRYISTIVFTFSLSSTLVHIYRSDLYMLPNALCIIFYDPMENHFNQYLAVSLSFMQLIACIIIVILHILLYITSYQSLKLITSNAKVLSHRRLTIQIILLSSSNFIGWFSSGSMYLSSVFMKEFPMKILLYATISFTALNSLVNPIFIIIVNREDKIV